VQKCSSDDSQVFTTTHYPPSQHLTFDSLYIYGPDMARTEASPLHFSSIISGSGVTIPLFRLRCSSRLGTQGIVAYHTTTTIHQNRALHSHTLSLVLPYPAACFLHISILFKFSITKLNDKMRPRPFFFSLRHFAFPAYFTSRGERTQGKAGFLSRVERFFTFRFGEFLYLVFLFHSG